MYVWGEGDWREGERKERERKGGGKRQGEREGNYKDLGWVKVELSHCFLLSLANALICHRTWAMLVNVQG